MDCDWRTELSQEVAMTMVVLACSEPFNARDEISEGGLGNLISASCELFLARLILLTVFE